MSVRVELVSYTPEPEKAIEFAARVSYGSKSKGPKDRARFLKRLLEMGHCSVFEFADATFLIEGCSRACANQLVRHRLLSIIQESQRRVRVEKIIDMPQTVALSYKAREIWDEANKQAFKAYNELIRQGVPKEDARLVLPLSTQTRLVVKGNFREWRHVLKLRLAKEAQWEIREMAKAILEQLYEIAPMIFENLMEEI